MWVTKRGLNDACSVVGNQLNEVSDTVHVINSFPWTIVLPTTLQNSVIPPSFSAFQCSGYKETSSWKDRPGRCHSRRNARNN
jgi:hypothetical protein